MGKKTVINVPILKSEIHYYNSTTENLPEYAHIATDDVMVIIDQYLTNQLEKARQEGYKKGYADAGIAELMKHENDKGNQI